MTTDPPDFPVITQVLVFLAATTLVVPALRRAKLSAVMGFLLIGILIGPHGLARFADMAPWLAHVTIPETETTELLAEFGVVFLLFAIGLEVSAERLWALKRLVFGLGLSQVVVTALVIGAIALAFGNSFTVASVVGLAFALSSTAVVLQMLGERRQLSGSVGRAGFSVLLLQDLAVVPILFLVAALAGETPAPARLGAAVIAAAATVGAIILLGRFALSPLFRWVTRIESREVFVAAVLFVAIGAAAAAEVAGLSMALGAFLAGIMLAGTQYRHQIETDIEPFKGLLLGLFFVTVGMRIDIALLLETPWTILIGVIGLFAIKGAIIAPIARLFGVKWPAAIELAFLLGQAGEFAFVIVAMALREAIIPADTGAYMLLVIALSLFVTPLVATAGARLAKSLTRAAADTPPAERANARGHVVIAGFGRVGQALADILQQQDLDYIALDANSELVEQRRDVCHVHFGDASRRDVLNSVGAGNAAAIVITLDDAKAVERVIKEVRAAWPNIPIYARARDAEQARRLHDVGAAMAIPENVEATLQLGEALLNGLGVPDEAARRIIDERRDAAWAKIFAKD